MVEFISDIRRVILRITLGSSNVTNKCMIFEHIAKDCKSAISGHCFGSHEMKDCNEEGQVSLCENCTRLFRRSVSDRAHSTLDASKCPIFHDKIKDKIKMVNYG